MIQRQLIKIVETRLKDNKAIIILGPRQVGKTTLLKQLLQKNTNVLWWNGDDADVRKLLTESTSTRLKALIGSFTTIVIDEAQRIKNIGLCIKLIVDNIPKVKVLASGSSAFELANQINEPLTGRKWEYTLFPLSYSEMVDYHGLLEEKRLLHQRLIFGYYPDVVNNPGHEIEILKQLAGSYLYKDILTWEKIQKPERLERLVQALAFQVGNEVSYNELGKTTGLDNETVEKYISLLEKAFIIFRLNSFSRNLRNELKRSRKIYFYDNGLRNAMILQFNPVELRGDIGALWENFLISERIKYLEYNRIFSNRYFWRTTSQQEIDFIEEYNGKISGFEFKWNSKRKVRSYKSFINAYPNSTIQIISPENMDEFLIFKSNKTDEAQKSNIYPTANDSNMDEKTLNDNLGIEWGKSTPIVSPKAPKKIKSSQKIITLMKINPNITISVLSEIIGISDRAIKKQINKLKIQGIIKRIGSAKGGHWEVSNDLY